MVTTVWGVSNTSQSQVACAVFQSDGQGGEGAGGSPGPPTPEMFALPAAASLPLPLLLLRLPVLERRKRTGTERGVGRRMVAALPSSALPVSAPTFSFGIQGAERGRRVVGRDGVMGAPLPRQWGDYLGHLHTWAGPVGEMGIAWTEYTWPALLLLSELWEGPILKSLPSAPLSSIAGESSSSVSLLDGFWLRSTASLSNGDTVSGPSWICIVLAAVNIVQGELSFKTCPPSGNQAPLPSAVLSHLAALFPPPAC